MDSHATSQCDSSRKKQIWRQGAAASCIFYNHSQSKNSPSTQHRVQKMNNIRLFGGAGVQLVTAWAYSSVNTMLPTLAWKTCTSSNNPCQEFAECFCFILYNYSLSAAEYFKGCEFVRDLDYICEIAQFYSHFLQVFPNHRKKEKNCRFRISLDSYYADSYLLWFDSRAVKIFYGFGALYLKNVYVGHALQKQKRITNASRRS